MSENEERQREKHDAYCFSNAMTSAEENGATGDEIAEWAAAYLENGDSDCICREGHWYTR